MLLLAALGVVFLVPLPVDPHHRKLFNLLSNAAHLPLLGGFAIALYAVGFARRNLVAILLTGCFTAAAVEWAQAPIGRTPSWTDFVCGCLGVLSAVVGIVAWRDGKAWARWLHALATLGALAVVGYPAWEEWEAIRWRDRQFPILADFEDERDLLLWDILGGTDEAPSEIAPSDRFASSGQRSLRVRLGGRADHRPGLHYAAGSKDWTAYRTLSFAIHNPGSPFTLGIRVDDAGDCSRPGTRYARVFELATGPNEFRIPLDEIERGPRWRKLDLTEITRVMFFPRIGETPREYFLDGLRLE